LILPIILSLPKIGGWSKFHEVNVDLFAT